MFYITRHEDGYIREWVLVAVGVYRLVAVYRIGDTHNSDLFN